MSKTAALGQANRDIILCVIMTCEELVHVPFCTDPQPDALSSGPLGRGQVLDIEVWKTLYYKSHTRPRAAALHKDPVPAAPSELLPTHKDLLVVPFTQTCSCPEPFRLLSGSQLEGECMLP